MLLLLASLLVMFASQAVVEGLIMGSPRQGQKFMPKSLRESVRDVRCFAWEMTPAGDTDPNWDLGAPGDPDPAPPPDDARDPAHAADAAPVDPRRATRRRRPDAPVGRSREPATRARSALLEAAYSKRSARHAPSVWRGQVAADLSDPAARRLALRYAGAASVAYPLLACLVIGVGG